MGTTIELLSMSQIMVHRFNLEGQHTIGMIRIELTIGDLSTSSIFYVIDVKTSYTLLLGRSWLQKHRIVASSLH